MDWLPADEEVLVLIISFSGIDSAGKTTQIDLFSNYLREHKISYKKVWSKARGTPGVLLLKHIVRSDKKMDSAGKIEYRNEIFNNLKKKKLLYIASMLDLCWYWGIHYRVLNVFYKYLICDRYLWDTYIEINHDFVGIDIDHSLLWKIVKCVAPKPRHSFVLIIPPEISLMRDKLKNASGIEGILCKTKKIEFYKKCIDEGRWSNVMDGQKSIEELHTLVLKAVSIIS